MEWSEQSKLKWNVNAGIGMSNWYGDDTDGTDAKFAYKVGIGLEVPFANTNIWSFQTGLNFISKGVKGDGVTDAWHVVSEFCSTSRSCFSLFNAIVVRV